MRWLSRIMLVVISLLALLPTTSFACPPADEWEWVENELNQLWRTRVDLCFQPSGGAKGRPGRVLANFDWLHRMDARFGRGTAVGILAHEWGHAVFNASELQSDCLAGFALRNIAPYWQFQNFVNASYFQGSPRHGFGIQRRNAVARGYSHGGSHTRQELLTAVCPKGTR